MGIEIELPGATNPLPAELWECDDQLLIELLLMEDPDGFEKWASGSLSIEKAKRVRKLGQLSFFDLENPDWYI